MPVMALQLQESKVSKAVNAILTLANKNKVADVLGDEFSPVQIQICVKKIPKEEKQLKLKLPHPIVKPDADVCLFVKDLEKNERDTEPTVIHFQELLSKKGVKSVKEIIPVKALKTDYKPFEAKWNLSNAYDIYLADERVVACLPRLLGKNFYGRKKAPIQVNLLATDLNGELHKAMNTSKFTFTAKGSSSMAVIGHSGMSQEDVTANAMAAVDQISTAIPGSSENIKQLSIKARSSTSLPIYITEGGPQDITIKEKRKRKPKVEIDELSTLPDAKVAVYPDGKVLVLKGGQKLKDVEAHHRSSDVNLKRKRTCKVKAGDSKSPAKKAKKTVRDFQKKKKKIAGLPQAKQIRKIK